MKKKLSLIGVIVLLLVVAIFSISNMQSVSVNFFVAKVKIPLVILIIVSILIGVIMRCCSQYPRHLSTRSKSRT